MMTLDTNAECCKLAYMLSVVASFWSKFVLILRAWQFKTFGVLENFPYKTEKVLQLERKNKYVYSKKYLV
jgi:hypothetical protein